MTRIVGRLDGPEGPLSGRLFIKAGGAFIGAPTGDLVFKIVDGIVDIEIPPCPAGLPYAVDWRAIGDTRRLSYVERWRVPPVEEMALEEARGLVRRNGRVNQAQTNKGEMLELNALRGELAEAQSQGQQLEQEKQRLLLRLSHAESNTAAAAGRSASLNAEAGRLRRELAAQKIPRVIEKEKLVERTITPVEWRQQLAVEKEKAEILRQENNRLREDLDTTISLGTHFANLHAEIDRLKNENQALQAQVSDLKQPRRSTSSLRREAIANLDQLINS